MQKKSVIVAIALVMAIVALFVWLSKPTMSPAFYYWRTNVQLTETDKALLQTQNVEQLYVRFFDVDIDPITQLPEPVAKAVFADTSASKYHIVPVVFITNITFKSITSAQCDSLAKNIAHLINSIITNNNLNVSEIQMDCDWSESTRQPYFRFLEALKPYLVENHWQLSATIRLHQVKYYNKTGIPPVDRGMLMFYNMGNLSGSNGENSIFNSRDASKYVASINNYPLPIDVALPVFSWAVQLRQGKAVALINHATRNDFLADDWLFEVKPLIFEVTEARFHQGRYFKVGDQVRVETVSPHLALEAAQLLSKNLKNESRRVAIFRLDSLTLQSYEKEDFSAIFDCFR